MELQLIRTYYPNGTNGVLYYKCNVQCYTIELPWQNNMPRHSCIPEGRYQLKLRYSPKFKEHLQLEKVTDRQLILVHPANDALLELKGCIAPVTILTGQGKGAMSRNAFERLLQVVKRHIKTEPVYLIIKSIKNGSPAKDECTHPEVL